MVWPHEETTLHKYWSTYLPNGRSAVQTLPLARINLTLPPAGGKAYPSIKKYY